jgi:hypothetical protein
MEIDMMTPAPPMTAAERQRACRARGKGRHRGGPTKSQMAEGLRRAREVMRAAREADALRAADPAAAVAAAQAASAQPLMLPAPVQVIDIPGMTTLEPTRAVEPAHA